ncbi:hypothetical protein [Aeromonas salmonicida]
MNNPKVMGCLLNSQDKTMIDYLDEITPDIISTVPDGYHGRCKIIFERGYSRESCAVFPTFDEAEHAANMGVNPTVGGYSSVIIEATTEAVTHNTAVDWLTD